MVKVKLGYSPHFELSPEDVGELIKFLAKGNSLEVEIDIKPAKKEAPVRSAPVLVGDEADTPL